MARKSKPVEETQSTPLTGKALLQKLKELPHLSRREKARECGYYTVVKDDQIRVSSGEFMNAVLAAKGVSLDTDSKDDRGRGASYRVSVHKNGQMVIGAS
jgi:AbrB-like transcriptional regulator